MGEPPRRVGAAGRLASYLWGAGGGGRYKNGDGLRGIIPVPFGVARTARVVCVRERVCVCVCVEPEVFLVPGEQQRPAKTESDRGSVRILEKQPSISDKSMTRLSVSPLAVVTSRVVSPTGYSPLLT